MEWTKVDYPPSHRRRAVKAQTRPTEAMQDRVVRVHADEKDLKRFWNVSFSPRRAAKLLAFYDAELQELGDAPFDEYGQEERADYLLLKNYLEHSRRRLQLDKARDEKMAPLLALAPPLVELCEARQTVSLAECEPSKVARVMDAAKAVAVKTAGEVEAGRLSADKTSAYRAANALAELRERLAEFVSFFTGYDPLFDWWAGKPYEALDKALRERLVPVIQTRLAGMRPGAEDEIVGLPIGRDGLLVELEAEVIPYTPEELLEIATQKYAWCEKEMKRAARELGFGGDWKAALDHVMNLYDEPGKQAQVVKDLVDEGAAYVQRHDLVTVPAVAQETWRMFMMTPARQKVNPFFLGGPSIIVSYPTADMDHESKLMSMRGNARHMSKATAFHEMIPGHRLQLFMADRHRPYRRMFSTPFYVEGWAMYWELLLWDRADFFAAPEDRVGTLFWRMHRCARILFSLRFHLGQLSPQECIDLLVDMVGHERATAEGEVRRSLNGDYGPLYQAGYFLGALQLWSLREEVLGAGLYGEKAFHDRVLQANTMPIEILRALLLGEELDRDYKSRWKFCGDVSTLRRPYRPGW